MAIMRLQDVELHPKHVLQKLRHAEQNKENTSREIRQLSGIPADKTLQLAICEWEKNVEARRRMNANAKCDLSLLGYKASRNDTTSS